MALHLNADDLNIIHWCVNALVFTMMPRVTPAPPFPLEGDVLPACKRNRILTPLAPPNGGVVRVYYASPQMMWNQYLLSNQVFEMDKSILYQDNNNAILLEGNGCKSSSRHTKHINIRYFYIKYHNNSG